MLAKSVLRNAAPLARKAIAINAPSASIMPVRLDHSHGPPANYRFATMDDLPVPCGSWKENYDNNQRKYNIHLLLGVGFFLITFSVGYYSGSFDLHLWAPEKPAPRKIN